MASSFGVMKVLELGEDGGCTECSNCFWTVHFKMCNFLLWELYLNKRKSIIKEKPMGKNQTLKQNLNRS